MGLFEHFPYTNFHDLNLDWILSKMKDLDSAVSKLQQEVDQIEGGEIKYTAAVAPAALNSGTLARMYDVIDTYRKHNSDLVYMHKPNPQFNYGTGEQSNGKFYGYSAFQYPNAPTYGYCGSGGVRYTDDNGVDREGLAINCSTFALLVMLGIPYEYTTYNSAVSNTLEHVGRAGYAFNPWKDFITAANVEDYYNTERLYKRFKEIGYGEEIEPDWHNVHPGSVLWCSTDGTEDGINHCAICMAVSQLEVQPNNNKQPLFLICEVGNWPYPVHIYRYSIPELLDRGFRYCALPAYGDTLPYPAEVLFEQAAGDTSLEITGLALENAEVITLDFDYTPASLDSCVRLYVNGVHPKGNNRLEEITYIQNSNQIGVKKHITFPVPIQFYDPDVHTGSPEAVITDIEIICHDETDRNNSLIENMIIYRGIPSSNTKKPYVIYTDNETDMVDQLLALTPQTNHIHAHNIPVIIAVTDQFTLDGTVTMAESQITGTLHVMNSAGTKRFIFEYMTFGHYVFIKHDGSNYAVTTINFQTP